MPDTQKQLSQDFHGDMEKNRVDMNMDKFLELIHANAELEKKIFIKEQNHNRWQTWIDLAHMIDRWRIFPRLFIGIYLYLLYASTMWFMSLPEPNTQQSALISTVVGVGAAWFGLYVNSGKSE